MDVETIRAKQCTLTYLYDVSRVIMVSKTSSSRGGFPDFDVKSESSSAIGALIFTQIGTRGVVLSVKDHWLIPRCRLDDSVGVTCQEKG